MWAICVTDYYDYGYSREDGAGRESEQQVIYFLEA